MKIPYAAAGLVALTLAGTTMAQTPGTADPAQIEGGSYSLEPGHTRVLFGINHLGFSTFYGAFDGLSGSLQYQPKTPAAAKLEVTIPIDSVETLNTKLDGELKSAQWFD